MNDDELKRLCAVAYEAARCMGRHILRAEPLHNWTRESAIEALKKTMPGVLKPCRVADQKARDAMYAYAQKQGYIP